jgi:hypothetical protein
MLVSYGKSIWRFISVFIRLMLDRWKLMKFRRLRTIRSMTIARSVSIIENPLISQISSRGLDCWFNFFSVVMVLPNSDQLPRRGLNTLTTTGGSRASTQSLSFHSARKIYPSPPCAILFLNLSYDESIKESSSGALSDPSATSVENAVQKSSGLENNSLVYLFCSGSQELHPNWCSATNFLLLLVGDIHEAPPGGDAHEEDRLDGVVKGERILCSTWER